jgi:hypothetical protein
MLDWIATLPQSTATFLGALTGSSIGLIAILIGALFNAHLNRRRDDRLRLDEARAVATALQAELAGWHRSLLNNAAELKKAENDFAVPDFASHETIKSELLSKLGLLDLETLRSVLDAYVIARQYAGHLVMRGGSRGSS